jgi:thermostable 8-oxoguanine DNA glycosylase
MAKATGQATEPQAKQAETYNPKTQIVLNKKKFEELVFCLATNRTKTWVRQTIHFRLAELLDLPGGQEEGRKILAGVMERVTHPEPA